MGQILEFDSYALAKARKWLQHLNCHKICLAAPALQVLLFLSQAVSALVFCIHQCECDDNTLLLSGSSTRVIISKMEFFFFFLFSSETVTEEQTGEQVEPSDVGSPPSHEWNAFVCVVRQDSCIYVCLSPECTLNCDCVPAG